MFDEWSTREGAHIRVLTTSNALITGRLRRLWQNSEGQLYSLAIDIEDVSVLGVPAGQTPYITGWGTIPGPAVVLITLVD